MGTWVQPKLTSNTSYGTVTGTYTANQSTTAKYYHAWFHALDGVANTWMQYGDNIYSGFLQWELPESILIHGITIQSRTGDATKTNVTVRCYTNNTKAVPIGASITINTAGGSLAVSGIPAEGIKTNTIYFDVSSTQTYFGINDITIDADAPATAVTEHGQSDIRRKIASTAHGQADTVSNGARSEDSWADGAERVLFGQFADSDIFCLGRAGERGAIDMVCVVSKDTKAESGQADIHCTVSGTWSSMADSSCTLQRGYAGAADSSWQCAVSIAGWEDISGYIQQQQDGYVSSKIAIRGIQSANLDTIQLVTDSNGCRTAQADMTIGTAVMKHTDVDIARTVRQSPWKYLNPGYAELLDLAGGRTVYDQMANPDNGVAYYHTSRSSMFTVPAAKQLYIKFDFYMKTGAVFRAYNDSSMGVTGFRTDGSSTILPWINDNQQTTVSRLSLLGRHTVVMNVISSPSSGKVTIWLDGTVIFAYMGNVTNGENLSNNYIQCDNANVLISNVIISDAPIALDEKVLMIPISGTEGWTNDGNGIFSTETPGAILWQKLDTRLLPDSGLTGLSINLLNASCEGAVNAIETQVTDGSAAVSGAIKKVTGGTWTAAMVYQPITGTAWKQSELAELRLGVKAVTV